MPGAFNRNPERPINESRLKDLRFAFDFWMALGGWFSAAGRNVCKSRIVPPGPQQECSHANWRQQRLPERPSG